MLFKISAIIITINLFLQNNGFKYISDRFAFYSYNLLR